jgi:hypothetical protein
MTQREHPKSFATMSTQSYKQTWRERFQTSANSPVGLRGPVLDEADNRCQDRASNAAAGRLTHQGTNIHAGPGVGKHWHEGREDLAPDTATNRSGNRIAKRAEAQVLDYPSHVSADCTSYNLNQNIDQHAGHFSLLFDQLFLREFL